MKIAIGSDHAAFEMKEVVKRFLQSKNIEVLDVGTHSSDRCDYPDYAQKLVHELTKQSSEVKEGILLCGSGIGVSIVANRFKGIRAALCRSPEDAEMAKKHNNANVLCLGARFNNESQIKEIIESWLKNSFEEGRHSDRLKKFDHLGEEC